MKWADFIFPPINLWCYPKQYEDYKMLNEETTVQPMWKIKENASGVCWECDAPITDGRRWCSKECTESAERSGW